MMGTTVDHLTYAESLSKEIQRVSPVEKFQALEDEHAFDHELHKTLAAQGVWGLGIADTDGGSGGNLLKQLLALRALGQHATSMGMFGVVQFLCTRILGLYAKDTQRTEFLRPLAQGAKKASFCLTEAGGGTDILRSMQTQATKTDTGYRLRGNKTWISGAAQADFYIVVARTSPGRSDGVSMFIVPRKTAGISVQTIPSFAVNVYEACEVTFDDVLLPWTSLLGIEGAGFRQLIGMLNAERLCAAANALGIARGAMQLAAQYVRERQAFGKALSQMQVIQHKLASVAMAYEVAWTYLVDAAHKGDKGEAIDVASSMAKVCASNAAELAVQVGMEVMGANGFDRRIPMQRYYRDHRLYVIAPLNNDMSKSLIAERYFGFDRA